MMEALVISNIVLWIAVVALAAVVLALLRQIGVLHERVAPAGALVTGDGPRAGELAPPLQLEGWRGEQLSVGGPDADERRTLLFFVSPTCPVCKALLPVVRRIEREEGGRLRLVIASDGPREEHAGFVAEFDLDAGHYVLSTELGLAHRVGRLPHAVLIDAAGIVRARGLVNTREHLESLFEAEERGLESVQEYLEQGADGPEAGRRVA